DDLLIGPAGDDPLRTLGADAAHFTEAIRLLLDDVEYELPKGANQLLLIDRPDTAYHPGAEIFLNALHRGRRRRLDERGFELEAMGSVVDPGPARLNELAG